MNRKIVYPLQIPLSRDQLEMQRNAMVGIGYLAEAVLGTATVVDGLLCAPTTPASLTVTVSPGSIFALAALDANPFGGVSADVLHNIIKEGINLDAVAFDLVPPGSAGQTINWLIQAALVETDGDNDVLSYVNPANPSQPWTGPGNAGTSQPTTRKCTVALSAKAGVAAPTGTQVDPAPDAGYVGLYSVAVPYGATTLSGSNITQLDTAPFIYKKLPELPRWVQSGAFLWGDDTGSANAIVARLTPTPTAYVKGMHVFVRKAAVANSGAVTANFNSLGAVAVLDITGAPVGAGNMTGSMVLHLVYDGTAFRWLNGNITNTSISSLTGTSGEGITVGGEAPYPISLNFPGLTAAVPTALDLFAFYDNEGAHHRNIRYQDLLALFQAGMVSGIVNIQVWEDDGSYTYTKTEGARYALVFAIGAGGGGGGYKYHASGESRGGCGGASGGWSFAKVDLSAISTAPVNVGQGGAGGMPGLGNVGGTGGNSSFSSLVVATGGQGGFSGGQDFPNPTSNYYNMPVPGAGTAGLLKGAGNNVERPGWHTASPGAPSLLGGGGKVSDVAAAGGPGKHGGGGGSASWLSNTDQNGGLGGDGIVIVIECA